jgi:hypothetical protein
MRKLALKFTSAALLSVAALSAMAAETPTRLPFIADDYAKARAQANREKLPLFVEVWAPW